MERMPDIYLNYRSSLCRLSNFNITFKNNHSDSVWLGHLALPVVHQEVIVIQILLVRYMVYAPGFLPRVEV